MSAAEYLQVIRSLQKSIETGSAPVPAETVEPEPTTVEQESTVQPEPAVVAVATEVAEAGEVTDEEIKSVASQIAKKTPVFEKVVEGILEEFDISTEEANKFAGQALEDRIFDEQQYADQLREQAGKDRDDSLKAQAEADRLFLENYGYKHRKRIKVSPEDEAKAAKLYRELAEKEQGPKTRLRNMSFTKKKKLYWLWQNRIPFGALTTIAGDPDEGKSLITLYLSACVSTGKKLYGNMEDTESGDVLLLSAEDDPEITLRPRLEAAGADLQRIHLLESVMLTDGAGKEDGERIAQLDTDIKAIEKILDDNSDIRLIIIDPISSFLGTANINREQEVRRVLQPLQRRARNSGIAVVMVAHFNKNSETRSAMDRVGGAKALVGLSRAAWTCIREPKQEAKEGEPMPVESDRRLFLKLKNNLAPSKIGGLVYAISVASVEVEDKYGKPVMEDQPYIVWLEETKSTAQEVVIGGEGKPVSKSETVRGWLQTYLEAAGGYALSADVSKAAAELGYSKTTLYRACGQLKVKQTWVGRATCWALPGVVVPTPSFDDVATTAT